MPGGLCGIVCFLLTHEILSTGQYMVAGLKKVRDNERSEHTAMYPVFPPRTHQGNIGLNVVA